MTLSFIRRARGARLALVLAGPALAAGAMLAAPLTTSAQSPPTGTTPIGTTAVTANPNNYDCTGHIQPGVAEPGNSDPQVQYYVSCDGPITGYSLVIAASQKQQITNFDASPTVELPTGPVASDQFSCAGTFPSNGFNCTGNYAGDYTVPEIITGQFSLSEPPCPKASTIDPQLLVDYATVSAGVVSQAVSGPFDLGSPKYCSAAASKPKSTTKAKAKASAGKASGRAARSRG